MPEPTEPTSAEVKEETTEPVATQESTTQTQSELLNSDAFVDRVAEAVFGKVKTYSESLIQAAQAAQQIAADMVPIDQTPPDQQQQMTEQAPPPDVQPQRRHSMFAQPLKRKQ